MSIEIGRSNQFVNNGDIASRYRRSLVRSYEHIPTSAIADVIINEEMAGNVTDPHLQKWFNPDYLLQRTAIFGFGNNDGTLHRLQTPSSHRSVYLQKDSLFFDEFGTAYGAISAKGTGTHTKFEMYHEPAGLFGKLHAEAEEEVSQRLANAGARVGRVLGRIILDTDKFSEWLGGVDKNRDYSPQSELNKVTRSGETAAIVVRLEGAERVQDIKETNYYSQARTFGRAARLHLREIKGRGGISSYLEYYQLPELPNIVDNLKWLDYVGEGGNDIEQYQLSFDEIKEIAFLYYYFHEINHLAAMEVSKKYYDGKLTIKNASKDVDIAGFWYDFETSTNNRPQYYENGLATGNTVSCPDIWSSDPAIGELKSRAVQLSINRACESGFQYK